MTYFQHSKITTRGSYLVGTAWPFRGCEVVMHDDGFVCNCKKRLTCVCYHIKSVQLGLLGVNQVYHK